MKLLSEDPRITAYVLGEIEDAREYAEIEAAVAASPELQEAVAELRAMSDLLTAGLSAESVPELSEFEKVKLETPASTETEALPFVGRIFSWPVLSSVAAILLLAILLVPQLRTEKASYSYQSERRADAPAGQDAGAVSITTGKTAQVEVLLSEAEGDVLVEADLSQGGRVPGFRSMGADLERTVDELAQAPTVRVEAEEQRADRDRESVGKPARGNIRIERQAKALPLEAKKDVSHVLPSASLGLDAPSQVFSDAVAPASKPVALTGPAASWNTEGYDRIEETDFRSPLVAPLSTFSVDVDTASYANVRRFLNAGKLPPADAVRIEELINYFAYSDAVPTESLEAGGDPVAIHLAQTYAPWNPEHRLLRVALKGYEMPWGERPASNLVFLLDVSGSMHRANKLPLVKEAMDLLIRRLDARDRVAIVVYAGASGLVLPSTTANNRETIAHALENLKAGGSTNAGAGIELAYKTARQHFIEGGNNRVILCTDGDFNVGQTNRGALADVAGLEADAGISLTVLGFGMGNYKDDVLELISNKGKGSYAYVDSSAEARKVFLEDLTGNLFKIAKDVKVQVEFNPSQVKAYRLIGYENRRLKSEDFNNDAKKAGDMGPGHTVVALYEIVPSGASIELPGVDTLRYQSQSELTAASGEVATVKFRYKQPDGDVSKQVVRSVNRDTVTAFDHSSEDVRFTAAVAAFGMRLSGSAHVADFAYEKIESIAVNAIGADRGGHRSGFSDLVRKAESLSKGTAPSGGHRAVESCEVE